MIVLAFDIKKPYSSWYVQKNFQWRQPPNSFEAEYPLLEARSTPALMSSRYLETKHTFQGVHFWEQLSLRDELFVLERNGRYGGDSYSL